MRGRAHLHLRARVFGVHHPLAHADVYGHLLAGLARARRAREGPWRPRRGRHAGRPKGARGVPWRCTRRRPQSRRQPWAWTWPSCGAGAAFRGVAAPRQALCLASARGLPGQQDAAGALRLRLLNLRPRNARRFQKPAPPQAPGGRAGLRSPSPRCGRPPASAPCTAGAGRLAALCITGRSWRGGRQQDRAARLGRQRRRRAHAQRAAAARLRAGGSSGEAPA